MKTLLHEHAAAALPAEANPGALRKEFLVASDFDQTLTLEDSGRVLSEMLGRSDFEEKVAGMARTHLVQPGGELAYLLLHDPEYRRVRKEHLVEAGKHVRLKQNMDLLLRLLNDGIDGHQFLFYVISAAPEEVIQSAMAGILPHDRIFGTRFNYNPQTGEIQSVTRLTAGHGKVAVLDHLQARHRISPDRIIYVGDGSSDLHGMLHVNHKDGYTIAVSENRYVVPVAQRTVLSENALSLLVPILEDALKWEPPKIRELFGAQGVAMQDWEKTRMDRLTLHPATTAPAEVN